MAMHGILMLYLYNKSETRLSVQSRRTNRRDASKKRGKEAKNSVPIINKSQYLLPTKSAAGLPSKIHRAGSEWTRHGLLGPIRMTLLSS